MRQSHVFLLLQLSGYKDKINCKKSYNVSLLQLAHITDPGGKNTGMEPGDGVKS